MYCLLRPCFQLRRQLKSKVILKYVCISISIFVVLDFFGAFTHLLEIKYDSNFVYPYNGNIHEFVNALRHNENPEVDPINEYNYTFILHNKEKCIDEAYSNFRVVYIVKSKIDHFEMRQAIRNSWGFEKRFFDVPSKTVFMLGMHPDNDEIKTKLKIEATKYKDVIQANFIDSYDNITIKTMMSFKWLVKYCSNSKFYMFVDDDIYVSVKNVLRFIRNPINYPDYLKEPKKFEAHKREIKDYNNQKELNIKNTMTVKNILNKSQTTIYQNLRETAFKNKTTHRLNKYFHDNINSISSVTNMSLEIRNKRQVFDFELPEDVRLFAGFVFRSSPHRHKSSKWYVPLSEYPYHLWPPYVTGGAYILSKEALLDMYYASLYTKHFRFDDIYLALIAKKMDIEPFHCEEFHFYKKEYTKFNYKYVISSHGYENPNELLNVWNEQKALGHA